MSNWHRLLAGFGACFAFALFLQFTSGQKVVVGSDRKVAVVSTSEITVKPSRPSVREKIAAAKAAREGKQAPMSPPAPAPAAPVPVIAEPAAKSRDGTTLAGPLADLNRDRGITPAGKPEDNRKPAAVKPPESATTPQPLLPESETIPAKPIDFGAMGIKGSAPVLPASTPPPTDPWAPVVTRIGEEPATSTPAAGESVLNRRRSPPESAGSESSIPDNHPSVAPLLARHPDRDLIICLAGCGRGTSIVAIRSRTQALASAEMNPTASGGRMKPSAGDVICLAGCLGTPGEVVHSNVRLSWITDDGGSVVRTALRAIADRLIAAEGLDSGDFPPAWVSADARGHLAGDGPIGGVPLAIAGPRVAAWLRRSVAESLAAEAR